jgi:hypothetical protein
MLTSNSCGIDARRQERCHGERFTIAGLSLVYGRDLLIVGRIGAFDLTVRMVVEDRFD